MTKKAGWEIGNPAGFGKRFGSMEATTDDAERQENGGYFQLFNDAADIYGDYGPAASGVYLYLARLADEDGECYPPVTKIAAKLKTSESTIKRAIRVLKDAGLIEVFSPKPDARYRRAANVYRLPRHIHQGSPVTSGGVYQGSPVTSTRGHQCALPGVTSDPPLIPNKTNTQKTKKKNAARSSSSFDPLKAEIPKELDTPDFQTRWSTWVSHRREIRKPLTPTSTSQQLKKLAGWGEARAIAAIEHTVAMGWTGIREPDGNGKPRPSDLPLPLLPEDD